MPLLSREAVLSTKLPYQDVTVPEWGGEVRVQQMSVNTRAHFFETIRLHQNEVAAYEADQQLTEKKRKGLKQPAHLDTILLSMTLCIVDEQGKPLFSMSDLASMAEMSHNSIMRLWQAVERINHYGRDVDDVLEVKKKAED